jgi:hypothetical protein
MIYDQRMGIKIKEDESMELDLRFLMIGFRNLPSCWNNTLTLPGFSKSAG